MLSKLNMLSSKLRDRILLVRSLENSTVHLDHCIGQAQEHNVTYVITLQLLVPSTEYASTLRQARQIGGLSELVPGARSMTDPVQKGNLRLYEEIIKCAPKSYDDDT